MAKKVAVLLSGCGFLDGAEIRESVLALTALSRHEAETHIYSLNQNQFHVVNHSSGEEIKTPENSSRNMMIESARIARGNILDIENLKASDYDALVLPGGFGVAKNFCDFAFKGGNASVHPLIKSVIEDFYDQKKIIGAICIAPALTALVLGSKGITVTIGNDHETACEIEKTGAHHVKCLVHEAYSDMNHKIVSTPAYMYGGAPLHKIQEGIEACIAAVIKNC